MNMRSGHKSSMRCQYYLIKLYDAAVCIFSVLDVFFDLLVTYQFYSEGHNYFLSISLFILFAAQVSYAVFMACALEPIKPKHTFLHKYNVIVFFVWLPFGQIVPLFLMIYSSYPTFFNKYFTKYGYRFQLKIDIFDGGENLSSYDRKRSVNDIEFDKESFPKKQSKMNDPLSNFIRSKLQSHFGFIIEAVIESIPQSILQMIYLIMYHSSTNFSVINIVSIVMSMTVVASKGTLLSYSIYRKASIFNLLCFAMDIFGIFTVSAWLFVLNESSGDYDFFGYHLWSAAYYYFDMLYYIYMTLLWIAFWGFNCLLHDTYRRYWNCPWRNIVDIVLIPIGVILLIIPVSLIGLTVRFTLIPLCVLRVFDHSQNRSYGFYNTIHSFIAESTSFREIHEKILVTNWIFAHIIDDCQNMYSNTHCLCETAQYNMAQTVSKELKMQYNTDGNVSLSHFYGILNANDNDYWFHYKYHQLFEVLSLLISKKGFWKFIWMKISCYHYKYDELYIELEIEFWKTLQEIQDIIDWKRFLQVFTQYWMMFIMYLNIIQQWFDTMNWRTIRTLLINASWISMELLILCGLWFWKTIVCDKLPRFTKWFCFGLKGAILQELYNVYYTMRRLYDEWINNKYYRYKGSPTRTSLTLTEHLDHWQDSKFDIIRNKQILEWNIPKCWSSYDALFKSGINRHADAGHYIYWDNNTPWIGRGLFVFVVVIIFKCIHSPLRNLFAARVFDDFCGAMVAIPTVFIVFPLVLCVAVYSIFVPILFLIQHCIYFGISHFFKQNLFQIMFTCCYLMIFSGIAILLPQVWKFVYSDFHLYPYFTDKRPTPQSFAYRVIKVFNSNTIRNDLIDNYFGNDIAGIIKCYLPHLQIWKHQFQTTAKSSVNFCVMYSDMY